MMNWVFVSLIVLSLIFGVVQEDIAAVSNAALTEGGNAITLCLTIAGVICLWSGIMKVAQESGLVDILAKAFTPILKKLFTGINPKGKAMGYIVLNLTANMLGLGNASTPFGIAAMKELEKEEKVTDTASNNMILFVILNTASLQLVPTTVAALRLKNGSAAPMEILPCVWIVSICTVTIAVIAAKTLQKRRVRYK